MKKLAIIEDDRLFNEALYQFLVQSEYELSLIHILPCLMSMVRLLMTGGLSSSLSLDS